MALVCGVINKHEGAKNAAQYLKRGVVNIKTTPDYVVRVAMKELTNQDESVFKNMSVPFVRYC